jgi:hypothetical protein
VDWKQSICFEGDVQKTVMMTRISAEIMSSISCERLRVGEGGRSEGGSWRSDCLGRAMSEAVVSVW